MLPGFINSSAASRFDPSFSSMIPANVPYGGAVLGLAQRVGNLLLGEFRALHRSRPFVCSTAKGATLLEFRPVVVCGGDVTESGTLVSR